MSTVFSTLKYVDERTKLIIFGYIHTIEARFLSNDQQIPIDIKNLCLLYYFQPEHWEKCGNRMQISSTGAHRFNDVLTQRGAGCWYCAYGRAIINPKVNPNMIFKWTLRYTKSQGTTSSISVGIISNNCHYPTEGAYCFMGKDYEYYAWETAWTCTRGKVSEKDKRNYGTRTKIGENMIMIELDIKNKT